MASSVDARASICRKDPVVYLSNGRVLQISETIGTDSKNVTHVTYSIHAPQGTAITRIVYTGGASTSAIEQVIFFADLAPGNYTTETLVTTTIANIPVTAKAMIGKTSGTTSGVSGQGLVIRLYAR